jgi:hypothetical protein
MLIVASPSAMIPNLRDGAGKIHGAIKPVRVTPNAVAAEGRTQIAFAATGTRGERNVSSISCGLVVVAFVPI